ncbi:probable phosphoglycerate mutase [Mariprofundus micogutta]|uniref:Probable phosphoglycerate mutase n=1 Tax=Mariprofundus micogutta TaxID=1921010 RepID=A0A1L8CMA0_9PROT|nr:histidine phosphatase family protein [Mariprofundus micogutta]GAV20038.1 probable phosphoglycerate mutase [Mariprofundus micogutta]
MLRITLYFSFLTALLLSAPAISAADNAVNLYYVRHAESLGNVTHVHSWYNDRTLSDKGKQQAADLARKLDAYHFDHIIVSPKYRALKTILPYLKKHGMVAEIWPELDECCWQKSRDASSASRLSLGNRIELDADLKPYFTFSHSEYEYKTRSYGDGIFQLLKASDLIKRRFAKSGKNILAIGHYHAGSRIFEILQGLEPDGRYKLRNARINHLKEADDGNFRVVSFNQ